MSTSTTVAKTTPTKAYVAAATSVIGGLGTGLVVLLPDSPTVKLIGGALLLLATLLGTGYATYQAENKPVEVEAAFQKVDPDVAESNDDGYDGPRIDGPPPSGGFPLAG